MSQNEWQSAWESFQKVLTMYTPYIVVSVVVSVCRYVEKHWKREPFSLVKLIMGLSKDLLFTAMLYFGTSWLTSGNHNATMFVVILGTLRGKTWADKTIDRVLWQRYGQGYYGGYGNDMYGTQNNIDNTQGDDPDNGNKDNHNGSQGLDPRE